jgi:hypothetical protein
MKDLAAEKTPEPVGRERALAHTRLTILRDWAGDVPSFENFATLEVDSSPLVLRDLNGAELFFEFTLRSGDKAVGSVKASASRLIGSPVVAVQLGARRWDPDYALKAAREKAKKQHPRTKIRGTSLVCYSYPKVGVRVDLGSGDDQRSLLYDASDLCQIEVFGSDAREGSSAWSFYDDIVTPHAERNRRRFDLAEQELDATVKRTKNALSTAFTERELPRLKASLVLDSVYAYPFISSHVLKYGPRCSPHDCFMLYAQQTNVYCAVATGQMILDFHRWPYTQDQIATAMETGAGGTSHAGQIAGYQALSNNAFVATYDDTADWSEAKAEIDQNRPVKSGIPGHARACSGWKRQNIFSVRQPAKRWLQIYDPWPWNADLCQGGAVVWEDWDAVTHTNFVYVRHA